MKRLILLGGGHAHVYVLDALAAAPLPDVEVLLVTPAQRQVYSGMLPGWIAGHYPLEACVLPLPELAEKANVRFVQTAAIGLDAGARKLQCADGSELGFDWLSIDIGSRSAVEGIEGAVEHALAVRPIEAFIDGVNDLLEKCRQARKLPVAVIGGGVAAVELAFAIQYRLISEGHDPAPLKVLGNGGLPLDGLSDRLQYKCLEMLSERGIEWHAGSNVARLTGEHAILSDGTRIPAGHALLVTGASAARWPAHSGLATDTRGFIQVRRTLQSRSHDTIFAAGDIAAYADPRPKSGVFAVRAGPPLAENLRRIVSGQSLREWQPQRRALYLVSTGEKFALAAWGPFGWWGEWVWTWKDHIDRKFMRRFGNRHVG